MSSSQVSLRQSAAWQGGCPNVLLRLDCGDASVKPGEASGRSLAAACHPLPCVVCSEGFRCLVGAQGQLTPGDSLWPEGACPGLPPLRVAVLDLLAGVLSKRSPELALTASEICWAVSAQGRALCHAFRLVEFLHNAGFLEHSGKPKVCVILCIYVF